MDTIESYLNTVFAQAPDSEKACRLKADMLANMQEKYQELKNAGHTENEAVGAVISEFGNVEELFAEMGVVKDVSAGVEEDEWPRLLLPQVQEIQAVNQASSRGIGLGALLIMLGVAALVCLTGVLERFDLFEQFGLDTSASLFSSSRIAILPVVVLFVFIVAAVGIMVFYGMKLSKYEYIEKGEFHLDRGLRPVLEAEYQRIRETSNLWIVAGVITVVGSVLVMLVIAMLVPKPDDTVFGVAVMLALIGVASYLFVTGGMRRDIYDKLLRKGEYAPRQAEANRVIGAIAAVYWPLTVVVYLLWSFLFHAWVISWIIWPVAGIIFGALSALTGAVAKARK